MTYKTKSGKTRIDIMIKGVRHTEVLPTRDSNFIASHKAKLRLGAIDPDYQQKKVEEPLFADFALAWVEGVCAVENGFAHTLKCHQVLEQHFIPQLGKLKIGDITSDFFVDWQRRMKAEDYAVQSINNYLGTASSVFKEALTKGLIKSNPVAGIKRLKKGQKAEMQVWSFEDRDRFLAHLNETNFPLFQLCLVALFTGMRPGELRGLCRDAIDFDNGTVRIHQQWCQKKNRIVDHTKTYEARTVTVPKGILTYLADKRDLPGDKQLFPFITNAFGVDHLKPAMLAAGVKRIRFHDLRHTFASHLLKQGSNLMEVKELLGHKKLESTMIYLHLVPDRNANVTEKLLGNLGNALGGGAKVISIKA